MTFRPALRPGTTVLRRDARRLQVGTSPGRVLAEQPGLFRLLLALDGHLDADRLAELIPELGEDVREVLNRLVVLGVAVDGGGWEPTRPDEARHLALAGHGLEALARRRATTVALHADGGSQPLIDVAAQILTEAGLQVLSTEEADVQVLATVGEPARHTFAEAVRRGLRHLVVRSEADLVQIGPFVDPGRSPCLRCLDLSHIDVDPAWAALLPQFGRTACRRPGTGALARHAAATAIAASVLAAVDIGSSPHAGLVETLGPGLAPPDRQPLVFHHRCACALLPIG